MVLKSKWKCVLVIDDDEILLKSIRPVLVKNNYAVLTANSGEEGLQIALKQKPDLIILDVIMPGIKGRDVCRELKDNPETEDIPVIFLTAKDSTDDVRAELDSGGILHLTKPFDPKSLLEVVKKIIG